MKIPFINLIDEAFVDKSPLYTYDPFQEQAPPSPTTPADQVETQQPQDDTTPDVPQVQQPPADTPVDTTSLDETIDKYQEMVDEHKEFTPLNVNTYKDVENVLPPETYKNLPTAQQVANNQLPENYESVINQFYPYINDYNVFSANYDISFDAVYFLGLGGLGGRYVTWHLGRESLSDEEKHKRDYKNCHCDANNNQTFDIDQLLNYAISYAGQHGFDPPAPMFGMSHHPNCSCYLEFSKATNFPSHTSISDTCPGLPTQVDQKTLDEAKKAIWNNIPNSIYVTSRTFPPLYITQKAANIHHTHTKFASYQELYTKKAEAVEISRPVQFNTSCISILPYGMWIPIPEGTYGIVTSVGGGKAKVFVADFQFEVIVKDTQITVLDSLTEGHNVPLKDTYFVMSNDRLGMLCNKSAGKYLVYFPDSKKMEWSYSIKPIIAQ